MGGLGDPVSVAVAVLWAVLPLTSQGAFTKREADDTISVL